jgi:hypothetical protein
MHSQNGLPKADLLVMHNKGLIAAGDSRLKAAAKGPKTAETHFASPSGPVHMSGLAITIPVGKDRTQGRDQGPPHG